MEAINISTGMTPEQEMAGHKTMLNLTPRPTPTVILEPPKKTVTGIVVDLKHWKMREYTKWVEVSKEVDFKAMSEIMAHSILSWDYEPEINPEGFMDLEPKQFKDCIVAVTKAAGDIFLQ